MASEADEMGAVPSVANLFADLPDARRGEVFDEVLARPGLRIERIVSPGQATPDDAPFVREEDEWVLVLRGTARIRLEGAEEVALLSGAHMLIPGGVRHWVTRTDPDAPTLWLAVHFG